MRLRVIASVLLLSTAVASAQPTPTPPAADDVANRNTVAADAKVQSATAHYANGELGAALADFAEAYHLDPRPDLLYSMAHLEIELGDCAGAIAHYQHYLATNPGPNAVEAANKAIGECQAKLGIKPEIKPADPGPAIMKRPPPPPPRAKPFYTDPLGDGLALGGLVGGATGLVLYLGARSDIDASETTTSLQAHLDLADKAERKRNYAVIAGAVGGALVIGAVVRWSTHTKYEQRSLAFVPTGDGWGIAALGRF